MAANEQDAQDSMSIRLPKPLKRRLRMVAASRDEDMSTFAVAALEMAVAAAEKKAA